MADENVFRFISTRAAEGPLDGPLSNAVVVQVLIHQIIEQPDQVRSRTQWQAAIRRARAAGTIAERLADLPLDLHSLVGWLIAASSMPLTTKVVSDAAQHTLGAPPENLVQRDDFAAAERAVGGALVAQAVSPAAGRPDDLVLAAKALALIRLATAGKLPSQFATVGDYATKTVVALPPLDIEENAPRAAGEYRSQAATAAAADPASQALERLQRLQRAYAELKAMSRRVTIELAPEVTAPASELNELRAGLARTQQALAEFLAARPADTATAEFGDDVDQGAPFAEGSDMDAASEADRGAGMVVQPRDVRLTLSVGDRAALSSDTRQVLEELHIYVDTLDLLTALPLLHSALTELAPQAHQPTGPSVVRLGGVDLDLSHAGRAFGMSGPAADPAQSLIQRCQGAVGVGDLLIVRQKLKAYELGDFAHVENVLAGESRLREHRRLDRTEEIVTTETEKETEKERDLQSTERNELQSEATRTLQTQMQMDAGIQVSGSYGPSTSFTSNLNVGFSTSTTESQRKAATYSREVVEKSAEKIRERVSEQRVRRVLSEIEEINKHGIDNPAGNGHVWSVPDLVDTRLRGL